MVNMALMAKIMAEVKKPTSLEEALADPTWKDAMQEEYDSILKNQTWELVDCLLIGRLLAQIGSGNTGKV